MRTPVITPAAARLIALRLLAPAALFAACNAAPGAPTASASAASAAPPATAATPSGGAGATAGLGGGVSVSSILGGNHGVPASTTWAVVADPKAPFTYEAPSTWRMHAANPWQQGGATIGVALAAGPDLAKVSADFSVPAVVVGVSANTGGMTARQAIAGDDFSGVCTATPVQDAAESGATIAYQLWESCAGGTGVLLVLAIVPSSGGLLGIVFQGTTEQDLGYLDHIVNSLAAASEPAPSAAPASGGSVSGQTYTISMNLCQNQHGQGVAEGLIRNDDALIHTYRIVVAYWDPNHVFLNDAAWTTSDLQPGVTARWQVMVPSGLPPVTVSCEITAVELVR